MFNLKFAVPALVLALGFVVGSTSTTYGKAADAAKTKQKCAFCHLDQKAKPKDLTDAGKYYKEHNNSLEGYKAK